MSVRRTVAALVGAALLLAGCTDEPEPRFEPTDSPSPSESETSAESEAQTPEEFIREWVELDIEMQNSGDTDAYLAVSSACGSCRDFAGRVEDVYDKGGHIQTDGWAVESISGRAGSRFRLTVDSRPTVVVEREGAKEQRFEGGTVVYEVVIRQRDDAWRVTDWYEVAQ